MSSTARTVAASVVAAVIASWIIASVPDLPAAGWVAMSVWDWARGAAEAALVPISTVGLVTMLAAACVAVASRRRVFGASNGAFLVAVSAGLLVVAAWQTVRDEPVTAVVFAGGCAWAASAAVRSLVRLARVRALIV